VNKYVGIVAVVGVVAIGAYFVIHSTSQQTSECAGDWTDAINPACWVQAGTSAATSEINTILIILAVVVILVVGLLAFGPQTSHIARGVGALAVA
jgi:hypothetical protein